MWYVKTALFLGVTVGLAPFYFVILLVLYPWRLRIGPGLVRFYSKICLLIYRVRIDKVKHFRTFRKRKKGLLIVSNHTSFLDIFVLSALFGAVFVSKREVKSYPVIGQIAWLMGVIFFDRTSRQERVRALRAVAKSCRGRVIAVFPQGTTGRITDRLPFNRGIFKAMELNPEITVLPVTLRYRDDAEIAWSGGSLKDNALRVAGQKMIHLKVSIHHPVTISEYGERAASEICGMVEETVRRDLEAEYRGI
jgi:1-acyl-sn-glycerol-3-phosphate acyltransferase